MYWFILFIFFFVYVPFKLWQERENSRDTQSALNRARHDLALTEFVTTKMNVEKIREIEKITQQVDHLQNLVNVYSQDLMHCYDMIQEIADILDADEDEETLNKIRNILNEEDAK